jgi:hypothetical protein
MLVPLNCPVARPSLYMRFAPPKSLSSLLLLAALGSVGAGPGLASEWQSLLGNSPFGQSAAVSAPTGTEIEFAGVVQEDGVCLVNLYNPATKTSQWIPVRGQVPGLEVRSYDTATDKVQIALAGRILTLPLKRSHVALVQVAAAPVAPKPDNAGNPDNASRDDRRAEVREMMRARMEGAGGGDPAAFFRNLPPEAQAMIQEFRRRRAEGAAGAPPTPAGQPTPATRRDRQ